MGAKNSVVEDVEEETIEMSSTRKLTALLLGIDRLLNKHFPEAQSHYEILGAILNLYAVSGNRQCNRLEYGE